MYAIVLFISPLRAVAQSVKQTEVVNFPVTQNVAGAVEVQEEGESTKRGLAANGSWNSL